MKDMWPNRITAANAGITPSFHIERQWPGVAEFRRSAKPVRNTPGMISNLLINTPLQRGDPGCPGFLNRFSGFPRDAETAEAVVEFCGAAITPVKRGVNEESAGWRIRARSGFPLPFGRGEGQGEGSGENLLTGQAFPLTPTLSPSAGERGNRSPVSWFCRLSHGFLSNASAASRVARTGSFKS